MYNKAIIIGYLGQDPEHKTLDNGTTVCKLSVATSESWKKPDGTYEDKTTWHSCIAWRGQADWAAKSLKKGYLVQIEGIIQNRTAQDAQGITKYYSEIRVQTINKLEKSERSSTLDTLGASDMPTPKSPATPVVAQTPQQKAFDEGAPDANSGDVPF